jgi:hypothetical protein
MKIPHKRIEESASSTSMNNEDETYQPTADDKNYSE